MREYCLVDGKSYTNTTSVGISFAGSSNTKISYACISDVACRG